MLRDLPSVYAADAHRLSQRLPPADQRRSPAPFLRQHYRNRPRLRLSPYELFFRAFQQNLWMHAARVSGGLEGRRHTTSLLSKNSSLNIHTASRIFTMVSC